MEISSAIDVNNGIDTLIAFILHDIAVFTDETDIVLIGYHYACIRGRCER